MGRQTVTQTSKDQNIGRSEERSRASVRHIAGSGPHTDMLDLQHAAGNQAVSELVQSSQTTSRGHNIPPDVRSVLNSSGQPLDPAIRAFMEPRFAYDFSGVRVHTDAKAAESAEAAGAQAFTVGRDMVFGWGRYAPETGEGRQLLAHELAHVVQQNQESVASHSPKGAEQEAAHAGGQAAGGQAVSVHAAVPQGIQRQPAGGTSAGSSGIEEAVDRLVKQTVSLVDDAASGKVLLSMIIATRSPQAMKLWALKLQQIPHSPYGNYLWAYFVQFNNWDHDIALKFFEMLSKEGIAISSTSGRFGSLKHLDPKQVVPLNPAVANLPASRSVDNFKSVKYELTYKPSRPGRLSTLLQLTYEDGTKIDLDIFEISDNQDPAWSNAIGDSYVGPGGRVFPSRMSRNTTPKLWEMKQKAIEAMQVSNEDFEFFVSLSLAGVMSNLPVGPVISPEPVPVGPRAPSRSATAPRGEPEPMPKPAPAPRGKSSSTSTTKTPTARPANMGSDPKNCWL